MSSEQLTGRDLDEAISVKLFGWRWVAYHGAKIGDAEPTRQRKLMPPDWRGGEWASHWGLMNTSECTDAELALPVCRGNSIPEYSSDWDAMRLVAEAMMTRGWFIDVKCGDYQTGRSYDVEFHRWDDGRGAIEVQSTAETLPVAVCRAALDAIEVAK